MASQDLSKEIGRLSDDFKRDGFGVIEGFLTNEEIEAIRNESIRLIKEESIKDRQKQVFSNDINAKSDYFITSGDKVRYFFEKKAFDSETGDLLVPEEQSLAKIAHALHCLNPVFREITRSSKVRAVFRSIDFAQPTVMQSMVIFKNPKVGGEYTPHQDASFLYCDPIEDSLCGIWLALDDANEENGCLEFIPGSHRWPLARRFVRKMVDGRVELEWTSPVQQYDTDKFVKVPVKKGALVLIHGLVVHRSAANNSDQPRWIYTFHAYDKNKGVYSKDNWLQIDTNDMNSAYLQEAEKLGSELADQYSDYLKVDTSQQERKLGETVEECLTHLEEVCSVLDDYSMTSSNLDDYAQLISNKDESLMKLCSQIEALEQYLNQVNQLLNQLESSMDSLESQDGRKVTRKLKQIISLLPRLSSTSFNILSQDESEIGDSNSDSGLTAAQREEILYKISQTNTTMEHLTNDLRDQLRISNPVSLDDTN